MPASRVQFNINHLGYGLTITYVIVIVHINWLLVLLCNYVSYLQLETSLKLWIFYLLISGDWNLCSSHHQVWFQWRNVCLSCFCQHLQPSSKAKDCLHVHCSEWVQPKSCCNNGTHSPSLLWHRGQVQLFPLLSSQTANRLWGDGSDTVGTCNKCYVQGELNDFWMLL